MFLVILNSSQMSMLCWFQISVFNYQDTIYCFWHNFLMNGRTGLSFPDVALVYKSKPFLHDMILLTFFMILISECKTNKAKKMYAFFWFSLLTIYELIIFKQRKSEVKHMFALVLKKFLINTFVHDYRTTYSKQLRLRYPKNTKEK